jgi:hypothetical protein
MTDCVRGIMAISASGPGAEGRTGAVMVASLERTGSRRSTLGQPLVDPERSLRRLNPGLRPA